MMENIGIIGAMDSEVENLCCRMTELTSCEIAGRRFYTGRLGGTPATLVKSGIGKVAAAMAAQILIDRFEVTALINTGLAGGLDPAVHTKDLVIGTAALQHDFNITAFGHVRGFMTGADDQQPTLYSADERLVSLAAQAAREVLPAGSRAVTGLIASGDLFVDDPVIKEKIRSRFRAAAAEMEGAAVAQVASANGVPFVILRCISDLADDQARISADELEEYVGRLAGDLTVALLRAL